jgi:hypothetical protein
MNREEVKNPTPVQDPNQPQPTQPNPDQDNNDNDTATTK